MRVCEFADPLLFYLFANNLQTHIQSAIIILIKNSNC
jgi:hypothetical protein